MPCDYAETHSPGGYGFGSLPRLSDWIRNRVSAKASKKFEGAR